MSRPASTKVFIDDYVVGRLPGICVVTGEPTTDQVRLRKNVSSANAVWFILILLGPVGWLVLLAVSLSSRNYLEGWVPYSHEVARRRREMWRSGLIAGIVTIVGLLVLAGQFGSGLLGGIAVALLVAGLVVLAISERREPSIELDASGRWVTLKRVHPAFQHAVERHYTPSA